MNPRAAGDVAGAERGGALRPVAADADDELRLALTRARRVTEDQPEPFRSLAFSAVLTYLLKEGAAPAHASQPPEVAASKSLPSTEIPVAEYLAQRRLDSHPDRVLAIAYYHYHRHGGQGVTTRDLVEGYTRSRTRRPQNFPDVIASCVRKGYLVDGGRRDGMKTWVITASGEAHVQQDM
ncbi:MAG TPA: hypothetical protein VKV26_16785 [Dehalococcoidia bacterium]|nr:hypothetical protein [Dehalococcoidia bacterium]